MQCLWYTNAETYDTYDEIEYSDLKKNGSPLTSGGYTFGGGNLFTYDATSSSYSAIFKFRWTAGSNTGIQFSFDKSGTTGTTMTYPFGVWVKKPNSDGAGANGAWHLKPTDSSMLVNMKSPATQGNTYDIEFGRLKVITGSAENIGKYYVYLKVNGELISQTYTAVNSDGTYTSNTNACHLSNELIFTDWGSYGNKISPIPVPETYDTYDEVTYSDLLKNGSSLPDSGTIFGGANVYTYNSTSSSHSAIFKFRWTAGSNTGYSSRSTKTAIRL